MTQTGMPVDRRTKWGSPSDHWGPGAALQGMAFLDMLTDVEHDQAEVLSTEHTHDFPVGASEPPAPVACAEPDCARYPRQRSVLVVRSGQGEFLYGAAALIANPAADVEFLNGQVEHGIALIEEGYFEERGLVDEANARVAAAGRELAALRARMH